MATVSGQGLKPRWNMSEHLKRRYKSGVKNKNTTEARGNLYSFYSISSEQAQLKIFITNSSILKFNIQSILFNNGSFI